MTLDPIVARELARFERLVPGAPLDTSGAEVTGTGTFASAFDVDTAVFSSALAVNLAFGTSTLDPLEDG